MSTFMTRERMMDYAAILNDVVAVLYTPKKQVTPADRRAITKLLNAMTDVNTTLLYHFNCRHLLTENLIELHATVARLAPRSRRS